MPVKETVKVGLIDQNPNFSSSEAEYQFEKFINNTGYSLKNSGTGWRELFKKTNFLEIFAKVKAVHLEYGSYGSIYIQIDNNCSEKIIEEIKNIARKFCEESNINVKILWRGEETLLMWEH